MEAGGGVDGEEEEEEASSSQESGGAAGFMGGETGFGARERVGFRGLVEREREAREVERSVSRVVRFLDGLDR